MRQIRLINLVYRSMHMLYGAHSLVRTGVLTDETPAQVYLQLDALFGVLAPQLRKETT